jgi:GNAT superfamily N-acetyltransferase
MEVSERSYDAPRTRPHRTDRGAYRARRAGDRQTAGALRRAQESIEGASQVNPRSPVTPFVTEALGREHDRATFCSGVDVLNRYLRELALQDMRRRVAGCFVALNQARAIVGFYTLAATSVTLDALPHDLTKRLPRYPLVPAVLMGRLAVAVEHQGQGLGSALIFDAAIRTDRLRIGAFAMIVDAKDDRAVTFYQSNGFALIPGQSRRLFVPVATALQAHTG